MFRIIFLFFLFLCFCSTLSFTANIKGRIILDETWAPMAYLSVIHSFDDLNTASYDFLRYQVEIDSMGYFEINDMELADEDRLYRLHICKKGDPVSTIIIGGQEENFIHFMMNKKSDVTLVQHDHLPGIQHCKIKGHLTESSLTKLFELQKKLNTPPELPSAQNRSFIKKQVLNDFQSIADTASNTVIRLLALHFIQESFASLDHLPLMERIDNGLTISDYSSPYYKSFANQLSFLQFQSNKTSNSWGGWLKWFGLVSLFALIASFLWQKNKGQTESKKEDNTKTVQSLSNQEKRVFNLLKKGKSNKEISSELHIEVSTVKSHLNKIYSRLGVKSRKDIVGKDL